MRCFHLFAALSIGVILTPEFAHAQRVGDKVVVISDKVEIKIRSEVIDTTSAGAIFVVREVRGEQIGINSVHGTGFIGKTHVIPLNQAVSHWTEAIRFDPEGTSAFIARGMAYRELQNFDKAIADYTEAIRIDPKSAAAYLNRGGVWWKKREFDKAIADYTEAIQLDPKYPGAYSNRGAAWVSKGDFDKAIANYNEAIRLDPKDPISYYNRGHAWQNQGNFDNAVSDYSQALRLDPSFAAAYVNRGTASRSKGDYENALADYQEALRIDPNYSRAYNARAWIWATCPDAKFRKGAQAVETARRAFELERGPVLNSIGTMAAAYAEVGDFENAVKWQSRAVELSNSTDKSESQARLDLFRSGKPYRDELKPLKPKSAP